MVIGLLIIELSIPYQQTIKERRNIVRSIKDSVKKRFNVSVADITEGKEITPKAVIGITHITNDQQRAQTILANVFNQVDSNYSELIVSYHTEFMQYSLSDV